jgi:RNA polymerase sigma-70 factor (ECF subfamily)
LPARFRELYDAHLSFVWRVLRRIGVPESDLQDAVQDVFVVVHKKMGEFEGRSRLTTWLFAICRRVASDRRRLACARREVAWDVAALSADDCVTADATALVDQQRARQLLQTILDRMPEEQRLVFSLFELDGMTGDEIAELLDLPVGTVRSRLRLAREAFRGAVVRLQARERPFTSATLQAGKTWR